MEIFINLNDARKKLNELEGSAEYNKGVTDAFNALFDLPTVVEPVKNGRWINYKDEHRCSCCGEVITGDWFYEDDAYSYCPNCGARMEE